MLLATAAPAVRAQKRPEHHRIAIVIPAGHVTEIGETGTRGWQTFFDELRRLGVAEGQNLTVERYSGEGRPVGYADLAREVVERNPDVIVAANDATAKAARAASGTIPIVWIGGDPLEAGLATSFARPGGTVTGVTVFAGAEIWGKRLQILKEACPSASRTAYLTTRVSQAAEGQQLHEAGRQLQISVSELALEEVTASAIDHAFNEFAQQQSDTVIVNSNSLLFRYRQLIVELAEKSRLPALYPWREYLQAGGLMADEVDPRELFRRMADDALEILDGAKPGDIPIYQPTKFALVISLKAANTLGLSIPPSLLARADEVIE